jgi:hypothetical protein
MVQPKLQGRRKEIGVVQGGGRDIDGRRALDVFIGDLAAAGSAKLAHHTLRGPVDTWVPRQYFDLSAIEREPRHHRSRARSAAGGTMANEGKNGLSGNTKPNRGTETATFIDLHGSPLFLTRDLAARRVESYQDDAATNMGLQGWGRRRRRFVRAPRYGSPGRPRILGGTWPKRCNFNAASPEADPRA